MLPLKYYLRGWKVLIIAKKQVQLPDSSLSFFFLILLNKGLKYPAEDSVKNSLIFWLLVWYFGY